eukprot:12019934-Alexandrium_andersonii.AAC.3
MSSNKPSWLLTIYRTREKARARERERETLKQSRVSVFKYMPLSFTLAPCWSGLVATACGRSYERPGLPQQCCCDYKCSSRLPSLEGSLRAPERPAGLLRAL